MIKREREKKGEKTISSTCIKSRYLHSQYSFFHFSFPSSYFFQATIQQSSHFRFDMQTSTLETPKIVAPPPERTLSSLFSLKTWFLRWRRLEKLRCSIAENPVKNQRRERGDKAETGLGKWRANQRRCTIVTAKCSQPNNALALFHFAVGCSFAYARGELFERCFPSDFRGGEKKRKKKKKNEKECYGERGKKV